MKLDLKEELLNSDNIGYDYFLLLELIKKDNNDINLIILMIEECIELYLYKEAKKYINYLKYNLNYTSSRITHLENKIKEIESNTNYIEDIRLKFKLEDINKKDSLKSIELCDDYYINTNNSDYIYIKAKLLYENNQLEDAIKEFNLYTNMGNKYLRQSYIFLYYIYHKLSDINKCNEYLNKLNDLFSYKDIDIYSNLENILLSYVENYNDKVCLNISKDIFRDKVIEKKKING